MRAHHNKKEKHTEDLKNETNQYSVKNHIGVEKKAWTSVVSTLLNYIRIVRRRSQPSTY